MPRGTIVVRGKVEVKRRGRGDKVSGRPLLADRAHPSLTMPAWGAVLGRCAQWATTHLAPIGLEQVSMLGGNIMILLSQ